MDAATARDRDHAHDRSGNGRPRTAVLVADGVEHIEVTAPRDALQAAGAEVELLSPGGALMDAFAAPFPVAGRTVTVRFSVGIALRSSASAPEDMIRLADLAMYVAKALGKSRYQLFLPTMPGSVTAGLEDRTALERSLAQGEFVGHHQPVVNLTTRSATGFKALVRWQHPERGLVPPLEFLGMAERLGILVELERCVLGEACREAAASTAQSTPRCCTRCSCPR